MRKSRAVPLSRQLCASLVLGVALTSTAGAATPEKVYVKPQADVAARIRARAAEVNKLLDHVDVVATGPTTYQIVDVTQVKRDTLAASFVCPTFLGGRRRSATGDQETQFARLLEQTVLDTAGPYGFVRVVRCRKGESVLNVELELQSASPIRLEPYIWYSYVAERYRTDPLGSQIWLKPSDFAPLPEPATSVRAIFQSYGNETLFDSFRQLCTGTTLTGQMLQYRIAPPPTVAGATNGNQRPD